MMYFRNDRIRLRHLIAATALSLILSSTAAMANNNPPPPPPTAKSGGSSQTKAIFIPTSAWLVGPISVQKPEGNKDMPCVMMNRFDNGFGVRISGTNKEVLAIAVDFRKDLFDAGEEYDIKLKVGDYEKKLPAQAYDGSTLVMNTNRSADLFQQIGTAKGMVVTFGTTDLPFSLLSAKEGLERLAACYSSPQTRSERRVQEIESSLREDIQGHEASAAKAGGGYLEPIDAVRKTEKPTETAKVEDADQQAVTAAASAKDKGEAPQNQAEEESDDGADPVGAMLDDFLGAADGREPAKATKARSGVAATQPSFPAEAVPRPVIQEQQAPIGGAGVMKWEAQQGGNLKDVLNIWTSHQKVGLLWALKGNYYLPRRFSYQGTFEDAVRAMLNEYADEQYPPRAKLYNDPQTGKAYLLIGYEGGK